MASRHRGAALPQLGRLAGAEYGLDASYPSRHPLRSHVSRPTAFVVGYAEAPVAGAKMCRIELITRHISVCFGSQVRRPRYGGAKVQPGAGLLHAIRTHRATRRATRLHVRGAEQELAPPAAQSDHNRAHRRGTTPRVLMRRRPVCRLPTVVPPLPGACAD